jgi:aryl-alcohol dehydrogenase-like predicted oxidoreductase
MAIEGRATAEGTARYAQRAEVAETHFRDALGRAAGGLRLSSLGLGTYLGAPDEACDRGYEEAVAIAAQAGVNVVDTAINYRFQRSERSVGRALAKLFAEGKVARDEILVATKGGFLPFDSVPPRDPGAWFRDHVVRSGLATPEELVHGCHLLAPRFLRDQIERSRANLGLATLDLYYLHNPETQLGEVDAATFEARLRAAVEALEEARAEGAIACWGVATWTALRAPEESPDHLSLERLLEIAREVGGAAHGFAAVQLPFNLAMSEAAILPTQRVDDELLPALDAARRLGLATFASAAICQARLRAGSLPAALEELVPDGTTATRLLQLARSAPGLDVALVGTCDPAHAREDFALAARAPAPVERIREILAPVGAEA